MVEEVTTCDLWCFCGRRWGGVAEELSGRDRRRELYCEVIRDIGILVLVFAPLDIVLSRPDLSIDWLTLLISAAVAMIIFGVHHDPRSKQR
jgi:hypothetical protein